MYWPLTMTQYSRAHYALLLNMVLSLITFRAHNKELSVSVVIPCVPQHVSHLHSLVVAYAQQTVRPLEVIIALSEAHKVCPNALRCIDGPDIQWPFKVTIARSNKAMLAGANRNHGVAHAQGDIIMFQDADDIPHHQRVEIAKYLFESYNIVHLLHLQVPPTPDWCSLGAQAPQGFIPYKKETIIPRAFDTTWYDKVEQILITANGQSCVLRSACAALPWSEEIPVHEDIEFNLRAIRCFPNQTFIVDAYLLWYRKQLSAAIHSKKMLLNKLDTCIKVLKI